MENRLRAYFKASVADLIKKKQQLDSYSSEVSLKSFTLSTDDCKGDNNSNVKKSDNGHAIKSAAADLLTKIQHVSTDEIMGGPIPSKGFTLRLVAGGESSGATCSFCSWLVRCQGCVLPDCDDVEYQLRDGESISVDWHYEVFEELLNHEVASYIITHPSVAKEKHYIYDKKIPFSNCLEKFTEQEALEGIVCPKCHEDTNLKRSFMLWRLPPVLIVQLKRFQFDRTARKKLNQRIDFPMDDLDLASYVSKTRFDVNDNSSSKICTSYDLCGVIHHVGALGGGHYVATIREDHASDKWHCFNDNVVSEITDISEVSAPSAYVLFYVRKDVNMSDLESILKSDMCKKSVMETIEINSPQEEADVLFIPEQTIPAAKATTIKSEINKTTNKSETTTSSTADSNGARPKRIVSNKLDSTSKKTKEESDTCISH